MGSNDSATMVNGKRQWITVYTSYIRPDDGTGRKPRPGKDDDDLYCGHYCPHGYKGERRCPHFEKPLVEVVHDDEDLCERLPECIEGRKRLYGW